MERAKSLADSYLRHGDTLRSLIDTLKGSSQPPTSSSGSIGSRTANTASSGSHNASLDSIRNLSPIGYTRDTRHTQILPALWQPGILKLF
jgi:hypothetical protein